MTDFILSKGVTNGLLPLTGMKAVYGGGEEKGVKF